jgi:hypothetical protein
MSLYLKLWFYDPKQDTSGYINKLVSSLDGPFCHCEIQFSDGHAFSVYMGTNVVEKKRTFDLNRYTCIQIPCSQAQLMRARECANRNLQEEKKFSALMMSMALTPFHVHVSSGTFCSMLCADILVAANVLPSNIKTCSITPSCLHRMLHERFIASVVRPVEASPSYNHNNFARVV